MDFVDVHWLVEGLPFGTAVDPIVVLPSVTIHIPNDRGGVRPHLGKKADGVAFADHVAPEGGFDFVFVQVASGKVGDENFPCAKIVVFPHGVATAVPLVKSADYADALGRRGPHGKTHAGHTFVGDEVRPHIFV